MSVLTVAGQKGGSGKSTLVRNLAIHFALDGYRVGIVDADLIQQHSSEFFADRSKEAGREVWTGRDDIPGLTVKVWDRSSPEVPQASIVVAPQADQDFIGEIIQALAEVADVVLCDLQGSASVAMLHAIHYADLGAHSRAAIKRRPEELPFDGSPCRAGGQERTQNHSIPDRYQPCLDGLQARGGEGGRASAGEREASKAANSSL